MYAARSFYFSSFTSPGYSPGHTAQSTAMVSSGESGQPKAAGMEGVQAPRCHKFNSKLKQMETTTQTEAIRAHLESGKAITPIEALNQYGCMRLGARIHELKHQGMAIGRRMVKQGRKHYAQYFI